MIKIESATPTPSPEPPPHKPSLADLSRNTSVISSGSSSASNSSNSSLLLQTPRPRPIRTFSSPRYRSRSPGPSTPRSSRPPAYLTRELGLPDEPPEPADSSRTQRRAQSKSKSRSSSANGRLSAEDFDFGEILGEGSYSTVLHATHRATRQEYAIKVLDKSHLKRNNKMQTALAEKNTLVRLGSGHPGIVRLHWAFQDEWSLYFVLDLAKNGELQSRISRMGSLSTTCARYYTAQLVDALGYMHAKGVIHRDLKPENLLLDDAFRIKVTDFGTGKLIDIGEQRAKTFVGTAQYVSPELLEANETSKSSDLWALGCIVYQMIAGRFAFQGLSEYLTWQKIKQLEYSFPEGFDPEARDLVTRLLVKDPAARLGAGPPGSANDMAALRAHPFLAPINWPTLWTDPAPPLEPGLVRREHHPLAPVGAGTEWEDVGRAWDELVGGDPNEEDEDDEDEEESEEGAHGAPAAAGAHVGPDGMEWAPDAEGTEYTLFGRAGAKGMSGVATSFVPPEEVGPRGELPDYILAKERDVDAEGGGPAGPGAKRAGKSDTASEKTVLGDGDAGKERAGSGERSSERDMNGRTLVDGPGNVQFQVPAPREPSSSSTGTSNSSNATGGDAATPTANGNGKTAAEPVPVPVADSYSTSSSDGSPVEKLGAALEAMGINRGRHRTRSPVAATGATNGGAGTTSPNWASVLAPGETMLFHSAVEETVLKRRTSRLLLPLPVAPRRPKTRELALTSQRLLCLKVLKGSRGVGIKCEYGLRPSEKEKEKEREKEERTLVTGVAKKGEREFAVLTETKSAFYAAENERLASTWVSKISEAVQGHAVESRERKLSSAGAGAGAGAPRT
ncbi:kinase-like protein [Dentipellis sp. KUC8613]|nr:kinase-like protein [Dentipellis sp. KUC8613]